jgi:hypothetical protein
MAVSLSIEMQEKLIEMVNFSLKPPENVEMFDLDYAKISSTIKVALVY